MARLLGKTERDLLRFLADAGITDAKLFNDVVLTKAIGAGYVKQYALSMVRITSAGYDRLEQLQDQGR